MEVMIDDGNQGFSLGAVAFCLARSVCGRLSICRFGKVVEWEGELAGCSGLQTYYQSFFSRLPGRARKDPWKELYTQFFDLSSPSVADSLSYGVDDRCSFHKTARAFLLTRGTKVSLWNFHSWPTLTGLHLNLTIFNHSGNVQAALDYRKSKAAPESNLIKPFWSAGTKINHANFSHIFRPNEDVCRIPIEWNLRLTGQIRRAALSGELHQRTSESSTSTGIAKGTAWRPPT